jgi:hypothetical protein
MGSYRYVQRNDLEVSERQELLPISSIMEKNDRQVSHVAFTEKLEFFHLNETMSV